MRRSSLVSSPSSDGILPVREGATKSCKCGATQARTGELVVVQPQKGKLREVAQLRGNGACGWVGDGQLSSVV